MREPAAKSSVIRRGTTIGEYVVDEQLGIGGFGSVYRATHPVIGKMVAVKVLHSQYSANPDMVARFVSEARAVNKIRHPNIVDIFAFGQIEDGRRYYVMELLEGMPLDRYLHGSGPMPPELAIPLLRGIAQALDAAHGAGIAHRDLKPENIFITFRDRGRAAAKLLDFGIAKLLSDSAPGEVKTRTGSPLGTPRYMSPEQCRNRPVDHRTDVYSFGILIHRSLTGALPFDDPDPLELLNAQANAPAPPMSSVLPSLPAEMDAPVLAMLRKDPAERPSSVLDALEALARAAREAGFNVPEEATEVSSTSLARSIGETPVPPSRRASSPPPANEAPVTMPAAGAQVAAEKPAEDRKSSPTPSGLGAAPRHSLGASSSTVVPVKRPVWPGLVAGAAMLAVIAGAAWRMLSPADPGGSSGAGTSSPTVTAPAAATAATAAATATPAATVTAAAATATATVTASASAAASAAFVAIRVPSAPPGTKVYLGEAVVGSAPGEIRVPRGSAAVTLRLVADRFSPVEVSVLPDADREVQVTFTPRAARPGQPRPKDLEPF